MSIAEMDAYEKHLIVRLTNDDDEAFCEIYAKYKDKLFCFVLKVIKSKELAEDICHDTFIVLWKNRHFLDTSSSLSSFLYTITRNCILYELRKTRNEGRIRANILSQGIDYCEDTQNTISANELEQILAKALLFLTPRQREIFSMSREKGMTHNEIANNLGISIHTVQEHISSALKIIRSTLKKHYGKFPEVLILLLALEKLM